MRSFCPIAIILPVGHVFSPEGVFMFSVNLLPKSCVQSCAGFIRSTGRCIALALVLLAGAMFASCEMDGGTTGGVTDPEKAYKTSAMPEGLKGTWVLESEWGTETYIIDAATFDSGYYKGTIAGHRGNGSGDGYITIEYTEAFNPASIGRFYVIHYKGLTDTTVSLSGAYLGADPDFDLAEGTSGKATQAEAEAVMTVSAGYFGMYSSLSKKSAVMPSFTLPEDLIGTWVSI